MNRKKYITLTLMLSLLCTNKVYAACTQEEINEFKSIEDEYKIEPQLNMETKKYSVKFIRTKPDKYEYRIYFKGNLGCDDTDEITSICSEFNPGTYKLEIIGMSESCNDVLKFISLQLDPYNKHSESPLCEGIEEFVLCQKTYYKELSEEEFESRVNTYKRTQQEKINNEKEQEKNKEINKQIISYIKEYLMQIIIVVVFIILIITTAIVTAKSIKKSRRLE